LANVQKKIKQLYHVFLSVFYPNPIKGKQKNMSSSFFTVLI